MSLPNLRHLALLALGLLVACQQLPHQPRGHDVQVVTSNPELTQNGPNDVAVLPLQLKEPGLQVPEKELRTGFQRALLLRRYSPLALEAVDRRAMDASYRAGDLREDAVLEITVEHWDASLWSVSEQIDAILLARLIDARGSGRVLWEGRLSRSLHGYEVAGEARSKSSGLQALCDLVAGDLLAALPVRTAVPQ